MVSPIIEEIAKDYTGSAKVGRAADVDADENQGIVDSLDITQVPTVILFEERR